MSICQKEGQGLINSSSRHEDVRGSAGIHPPFSTSSLNDAVWSHSHTGRFNPGKQVPVTVVYEVGWGPGPVSTL
jgi:hypothetical protein